MPLPNTLKVQFSDTCTSIQRRIGAKEAKVLQIKTLTADGEPVKKHMEIKLPLGMEYKVGDALAVLPSNPKSSVLRALRRFNVPVRHLPLIPCTALITSNAREWNSGMLS